MRHADTETVHLPQVAPLPGLHAESLQDTEGQLALLCRLLPGVAVPSTLALLEVGRQRPVQPICPALGSVSLVCHEC